MKVERVEAVKLEEDMTESTTNQGLSGYSENEHLSASTENYLSPDSRNVKNEKLRRDRTRFNQQQKMEMERVFLRTQHPDYNVRCTLAQRIGLKDTIVQVWFKNRRSRYRKEVSQRQQLPNTVSSTTDHTRRFTPPPLTNPPSYAHYSCCPSSYPSPLVTHYYPSPLVTSYTSPQASSYQSPMATSYPAAPMECSTPTCSQYLTGSMPYNFSGTPLSLELARHSRPPPPNYNYTPSYHTTPSYGETSGSFTSAPMTSSSTLPPGDSYLELLSSSGHKSSASGDLFEFLP